MERAALDAERAALEGGPLSVEGGPLHLSEEEMEDGMAMPDLNLSITAC